MLRLVTGLLLLTFVGTFAARAQMRDNSDAASADLDDYASGLAPDDAGARQRRAREWDVLLGLGAAVRPTYLGSDRHVFSVGPYGYATWNDMVTLDPGQLSLYWHHERIKIGAALTYSPGRRDTDQHGFFNSGDSRLQGLGDIDRAVGLKAFANYPLGLLELGLSVVKFEGHDNDGTVATARLSTLLIPLPRTIIRPHVDVVWANTDYMETFFGVTPQQSSQSIFPVFEAHQGVRDVSAGVSLERPLDEHWQIGAQLDFRRMEGDAARSPITFSRNNTVFGLGAGYHFRSGPD